MEKINKNEFTYKLKQDGRLLQQALQQDPYFKDAFKMRVISGYIEFLSYFDICIPAIEVEEFEEWFKGVMLYEFIPDQLGPQQYYSFRIKEFVDEFKTKHHRKYSSNINVLDNSFNEDLNNEIERLNKLEENK